MARLTNKQDIKTLQKDVTTSGTPVQLPSHNVDEGIKVVIKAKRDNTGLITIGNSSANALNTGTEHFPIESNQSVGLQVNNTDLIWIDSTVDGDGVEIIFEF